MKQTIEEPKSQGPTRLFKEFAAEAVKAEAVLSIINAALRDMNRIVNAGLNSVKRGETA